jgi:predicted ATPase
LARQRSALMIFEDLHWIDPTSREFIDLVLARIDRLPVLLVATFRPEFQPPWTGQSYVTVMSLNRLGRGDGAAMVERLAGNATLLPPDVIAEIVERTDGVPLFVEEMTKAVLEAGAERGREIAASVPVAGLGVPATLQASLMARLDRLGPAAKAVAQIGAAIGREFSYELAASVGDLSEEGFQESLQRLVDAGLVFQRGAPPAAEYLFKHALVQDTAYGTLLRGPRQQLHALLAASLEAHFPDRVAREPEVLARHFSEAQQPDRALGYWLAAGERAIQRSANQEAIGHLTAGLAQLAQLPETRERAKQELALQRLLGQAALEAKGFSSAEALEAFRRARGLCQTVGDEDLVPQVLLGVWLFELSRAEHKNARKTAGEALERAEHIDDDEGRMASNALVAVSELHLGAPARAHSYFERAIALGEAARERRKDVGSQPGALAHRFLMDNHAVVRGYDS